MKKDKQGLAILKGLIEKGDLKLKIRLKETKEGRWALGTLTYQGKQVCSMRDPNTPFTKSDKNG